MLSESVEYIFFNYNVFNYSFHANRILQWDDRRSFSLLNLTTELSLKLEIKIKRTTLKPVSAVELNFDHNSKYISVYFSLVLKKKIYEHIC